MNIKQKLMNIFSRKKPFQIACYKDLKFNLTEEQAFVWAQLEEISSKVNSDTFDIYWAFDGSQTINSINIFEFFEMIYGGLYRNRDIFLVKKIGNETLSFRVTVCEDRMKDVIFWNEIRNESALKNLMPVGAKMHEENEGIE